MIITSSIVVHQMLTPLVNTRCKRHMVHTTGAYYRCLQQGYAPLLINDLGFVGYAALVCVLPFSAPAALQDQPKILTISGLNSSLLGA